VQIGAIVTLTQPEETDSGELAPSRGFPRNAERSSILGHKLLDLVKAELYRVGIGHPSIVVPQPGLSGSSLAYSARPEDSGSAWEQAVADWIGQQVELLLLVGTGTYTDLDFGDLIRFHLEQGSLVSEAYGKDGPLDIAIVSREAMRGEGSYSQALSRFVGRGQRFFYSGYVNRLRTPADFMQLIGDGLTRRSRLEPAGTEIAQGIWFGDDADVDPTCVIRGPAFVGSGTRVNCCCTLKSGSAIESGCDIDSGTTVEESWILPETYVGVGLNVRRSIVSNGRMFHLDRQTEVTIIDRRLIGAARSSPLFGFEKDC